MTLFMIHSIYMNYKFNNSLPFTYNFEVLNICEIESKQNRFLKKKKF